MTLFLYETAPSADQQAEPAALVDALARVLTEAGAEVIETQITKGAARVFTIVELLRAVQTPPPWTRRRSVSKR